MASPALRAWSVCLLTTLIACHTGMPQARQAWPHDAHGTPTWGWTDRSGRFHPLRGGQSDGVFRLEADSRPITARQTGITIRQLAGRFTAVGDMRNVRSVGVRVPRIFDRPDIAFAPHLTPASHLVISDHTFRSPVVLESKADRIWALIPDLDLLARERPAPWAFRYEPGSGHAELLACPVREDTHVFYAYDDSKPFPLREGQALPLRAFWITGRHPDVSRSPHGFAADFLWHRFAHLRKPPLSAPISTYIRHAYGWAYRRWKAITWQEFELDGNKVGGVVFIVTVHQAPGRGDPDKWREKKSLWNQVWFSSLRSSIGLMRHARRTKDQDLQRRARLGLEFALAAPQKNGFFPAVYVADKKGDWQKGKWVWANDRRPPQHRKYCHLTDASWTCDKLLEWHREIEPDPRIVPYCERYAESLLKTQQPSGAFPSWVDPGSFNVSPFLRESPQGMTSVMFLHSLYEATKKERYLQAARRCADFVAKNVLPHSRWEDFETYYSCADEGPYKQIGQRDPVTRLYPANTFSMWWAAEGFLRLGMLPEARKALDELSLYQQVWSPPFLFVPASGGFGVQNTDGEWNDARQSLFARTLFKAARALGDPVYEQRARLALAASFIMMYCPENPGVRRQYELKWKQLNATDYGFMMENYAHGGFCKPDGTGIGEFTIWDWGPGGAAEMFEWAIAHGFAKTTD